MPPRFSRRLFGLVILAAFVVGGIAPAWGYPVVFGFRGHIDRVFDGLAALPPSVVPGIPYYGAYVFESTTPNTAPSGDEGELGLYHHSRRPAGVVVVIGGTAFVTSPRRPDFDVIVSNDFGFAGTDGYGFLSRNNHAFGTRRQLTNADRLDVGWDASTFDSSLFSSADLPLVPPDLDVLGGGQFRVEGECLPCASPAAFYRIEGTMTSLFPLSRIPPGLNLGHTEAAFAENGANSFATLVPEPWGFASILGSLPALVFARRWTRQTPHYGNRRLP